MSFDNVPLMSKIVTNTPLNTTIYKSIDLFDQNQKYVKPFQGFGMKFKTAGSSLKSAVLFEIITCWIIVYFVVI